MKKTIGLIVNPVAGMGGSVGLKGTDGEMYKKALALGAEPVAPRRTLDMLARVKQQAEIDWLVAPGKMGVDYVLGKMPFTVVRCPLIIISAPSPTAIAACCRG